MKFLESARLILSLLPVLIQAIHAVEEAIPGEGRGETKLALIRAALAEAYATAEDVSGAFDQVWPAIARTIGHLVSTYNALGVFRRP